MNPAKKSTHPMAMDGVKRSTHRNIVEIGITGRSKNRTGIADVGIAKYKFNWIHNLST